MKPFDLKKLSERRVELMARLEGMVSTCQMETRAFNEEERASYSKILDEVRSIDATLDAAEQGQALSQVERRAAAAEETHTQEELENRAFECYVRGIAPELETREAVNMTVGDNGAVIPTSIANKIIGMVKEISPLYQRATHYNVGGNLTIPSYDESTQKITMAYATEFTALTSHFRQVHQHLPERLPGRRADQGVHLPGQQLQVRHRVLCYPQDGGGRRGVDRERADQRHCQ